MKKLILLTLTVALTLSCFVSCSMAGTGGNKENHSGGFGGPTFEAILSTPADEENATYTVTSKNEDGVEIEITAHGYRSESLKKDFYVKSNEYFTVDVKVTNRSEGSIYRNTSCMESASPHNHEIDVDLSYDKYKLNTGHFGFECAEKADVLEIKSGESHSWQLKVAAGEPSTEKYDLPSDGEGGILLYGREIYQNIVDDDLKFEIGTDTNGKDENQETSKDKDEKKEKSADKEIQEENSTKNTIYETYHYVTGEGIVFNSGSGIAVNGSFSVNTNISAIVITSVLRIFDGSISFAYTLDADSEETHTVSADLSVEVRFISQTTNQNDKNEK